ncbi:MAG: type II toxin-antitoxin system RelE/ParE family toxin [Terracidiphilus sp.]|jgi:addiction module RelE/StbE family toxin
MKISRSPTAVSDLEAIREYIAKDNSSAARKVANRIKESVNRLIRFPLSGRVGRLPGTRELVVPGTSYIAAYTIQGDELRIASVLHGQQRWPESF